VSVQKRLVKQGSCPVRDNAGGKAVRPDFKPWVLCFQEELCEFLSQRAETRTREKQER